MSQAMSDSDSDVSLPSGDPEKYWWIGGDNPFGYPEEGEPSATASSPSPDHGSSANNSQIIEMEDLARDLQQRIMELEDVGERRDEDLSRSAADNNALVERVASLCTYICTMWVDQAASKAWIRTLLVYLWLTLAVIVGYVEHPFRLRSHFVYVIHGLIGFRHVF